MNKKKAITILENQIKSLDKYFSGDSYDMTWKIQTLAYLKKIFGEESSQFEYFNKIRISSQKPDPTRFLNECIEVVKNIGVYKEPKKNILSSLHDSIIAIIITAIGTVSFSVGKYTSDAQNIELKIENKELSDSLSLFKSGKITNVEKNNTKNFYHKKDTITK